jgi:hypothetical protein
MDDPQSSIPDGTATMHHRSDPHGSTVNPPPPNNRFEGAGDAALYFESPLWLALASGCESHRDLRTPVIDMTKIRGPGSRVKERENYTDDLPSVMAAIDSKTEILHITEDVPSNDQWEALGKHFDNVRFLKVAAGWDESWIDDKFPLNWPLELLVITDAVGERITTPAIMEGRVKHLVLLFTSGLRFEGPTTKELMKDAEVLHVIPRKPKAPDTEQSQAEGELSEAAAEPEGKPEGIKVYSVPHEWHKWVYDNYAHKTEILLSLEPPQDTPPSAMKHLSILGNDALEMLTGIGLAKYYLLTSLDSLSLYSTSKNDLMHIPPNFFLAFFPGLTNLKTLKLTLGSSMYAALLEAAGTSTQPFLHAYLPPNIETLHFRGPVSMVPHLDEFVGAFGSEDFLPRLKRISFVLDFPDEGLDSPKEPSLDGLRAAHAACRKVLDAAAKRGVVVEGFREPWVEWHQKLFREVDNRWAVLDEKLGS